MMLGVIQNIMNQNSVKLTLFSGGMLYKERSATRVASRVPRPYREIGMVAIVAAIATMKMNVRYGTWMLKSCAMKYSSVKNTNQLKNETRNGNRRLLNVGRSS